MDTSNYVPVSATLTPEEILNRDILELMGVQDMPEDKKAELYEAMVDTIHTRAVARIDDVLTDEDALKMKEIIDTGEAEQFHAFLLSKGIDIGQIYTDEIMLYKVEMTELAKILDRNANNE